MGLKQNPNPTKNALSKKVADDMHIHGSFKNLHVVSYVDKCLLLLILTGCFFVQVGKVLLECLSFGVKTEAEMSNAAFGLALA